MWGKILLGVLITVVVIIGVVTTKSCFVDTYIIEGTVNSKFLSPADGGTTFIILLADNQTKLEIKRNFWYSSSEFNEDLLYQQVEVGKKYKFTCWGWQLDWWTVYWYPNVIKIEQIP